MTVRKSLLKGEFYQLGRLPKHEQVIYTLVPVRSKYVTDVIYKDKL